MIEIHQNIFLDNRYLNLNIYPCDCYYFYDLTNRILNQKSQATTNYLKQSTSSIITAEDVHCWTNASPEGGFAMLGLLKAILT